MQSDESLLPLSVRLELEQKWGTPLSKVRSVAGGCIHQTVKVTFTTGERVFVKWNTGASLDAFAAEADGLAALREKSEKIDLHIPEVYGAQLTEDGCHAWLAVEWIETSAGQPRDFFERFGRGLARLHQQACGERFGWHRDNFLGATPQRNSYSNDWVNFVRDCRLGPMLDQLSRQRAAPRELLDLGERLLLRLDEILATNQRPALLHGDLWSGNYLSGAEGFPVLIDPAVYLGDREAEMGMLMLFGSCPQVFYEAYQEVYPFAEGWRRRVKVYRLYHLLNHFVLFGNSYLAECLEGAKDVVLGPL
jgi:fructosamine-3-kinase